MNYFEVQTMVEDNMKRGYNGLRFSHNSKLVKTNLGYGLKLHDTIVCEWTREGDMILRTGGFFTRTTKTYINKCLPAGYHLYQKKHNWYLDMNGVTIPFTGNLQLAGVPR